MREILRHNEDTNEDDTNDDDESIEIWKRIQLLVINTNLFYIIYTKEGCCGVTHRSSRKLSNEKMGFITTAIWRSILGNAKRRYKGIDQHQIHPRIQGILGYNEEIGNTR